MNRECYCKHENMTAYVYMSYLVNNGVKNGYFTGNCIKICVTWRIVFDRLDKSVLPQSTSHPSSNMD